MVDSGHGPVHDRMRLRHVIADRGECGLGDLRPGVENRVARELGFGRDSGLVVLRKDGPPQQEACSVPTHFLPLTMSDAAEGTFWLPAALLEDTVESCADRTLFLLHGGLGHALTQLAETLRRRLVPYVVVTHGFYSGLDDPPACSGPPNSSLLLKELLEAARSVDVASYRERELVHRIAPLSRLRRERRGGVALSPDAEMSVRPWP